MKPVEELDRYLFGEVSAARPYLLVKGVLLLLSLDAWVVMIEHGGRYGVGGFNVAHFRILDALQPVPTTGLYVGLMLFIGMLAFVSATGGSNRLALGGLAALYTWGWSMSMLDSFQHHYLLSLVLITFIGFPVLGGRAIFGEGPGQSPTGGGRRRKGKGRVKRASRSSGTGPRRVSAWAYSTLMVSVAVVYCYTAFSKTEEDWRMGHALQRIAAQPIEPFRQFFVDTVGLTDAGFWALVGHSVIFAQVIIAAGYLLAPLRDRGDRATRVLCSVSLLTALSFHLGAEYLELRIGWFSWYMIILALVAFLPERAVWVAGDWLSRPARLVARRLQASGEGAVIPVALGAALVVGLAGYAVDLPGSTAAAIAAGVLVAGATVYLFWKGRGGESLRWVAATAAAALCMWSAIAASHVRFDYYRFVGGDARRRGEYEAALEAYVKANRYAPADDDRKDKEEQMRRIVESGGGRR